MQVSPPSAEQVNAALEEILRWPDMLRSPQLAGLLRYVVARKLDGDEQSIKAYSIAVDVFGRPADFDPQADPIVRVQARRLRGLLEQFYAGKNNLSAVRIRMPTGRYVPEFSVIRADAEAIEAAIQNPPRQSVPLLFGYGRRPSWAPMWTPIISGFLLALAGAVLALLVQFWIGGNYGGGAGAAAQPEPPSVSVGTVANSTDDTDLYATVAELRLQVLNDLSHFDDIVVTLAPIDNAPPPSATAPRYLVDTILRRGAGGLEANVLLSDSGTRNVVWSTTIPLPVAGPARPEAITNLAVHISALLAANHGPLHDAARAWLNTHDGLPDAPGTYLCQRLFYAARDSGNIEDGTQASACLARRLAIEPADGVALAARAGLDAAAVVNRSRPGDALVALLFDQSEAARDAVRLAANSSFVHEQLARIEDLQGARVAAAESFRTALALNPGNLDARAAFGLMLIEDGEWDLGLAQTEQAIAANASPPPWYFAARALAALRDARSKDVVENALVVAISDSELGPALILASAVAAGRSDLIVRFEPILFAQAGFQRVGILPRLNMRIREGAIQKRIRDGLLQAGIPAAKLDGPFAPG